MIELGKVVCKKRAYIVKSCFSVANQRGLYRQIDSVLLVCLLNDRLAFLTHSRKATGVQSSLGDDYYTRCFGG